MPMNEANGTTSSDTLQGWKEIANHLGRSTRAAQRWERELGLPVHRIKTVDGQTVYATRSELDDWRKSRDLPKAVPEDDETTIAATELELKPAPTADSKTPPPTNVTTAPSWRFLLASCFAALAVGVVSGTVWWH